LTAEAERTLGVLATEGNRFGILPGQDWGGGNDPWSAPTAWTAWSLAALAREHSSSRKAADHRLALRLLAGLRRAATPAGTLPERVDYRTGIPTSTTPLAWSHSFAILALRELWPERTG
jgi:GH15 family glucan-1,4-alpha-glucosidase